jgi:alpha-L-rhamnosidase
VDYRKDILVAPPGPPVRKTDKLKPLKIIHTQAGETVFDMGQNMVGWVRLTVHGPAGAIWSFGHRVIWPLKTAAPGPKSGASTVTVPDII